MFAHPKIVVGVDSHPSPAGDGRWGRARGFREPPTFYTHTSPHPAACTGPLDMGLAFTLCCVSPVSQPRRDSHPPQHKKGRAVPGGSSPAVPKQGTLWCPSTAPVMPTSKPWVSVGPAPCAHEPSLSPSQAQADLKPPYSSREWDGKGS